MQAKWEKEGSYYSIAQDLRQIIKASRPQNISQLPEYASLIYTQSTLKELAKNIPIKTLAAFIERGGEFERKALEFIELMEDPKEQFDIYRSLAGGYDGGWRTRYHRPRNLTLLQKALVALESMPDGHHKEMNYRVIAPDFARARKTDLALEIFYNHTDHPEWVYADIAKATGVGGNVQKAWDLFHSPDAIGADLMGEMIEEILQTEDPMTIIKAIEFLLHLEDPASTGDWIVSLCRANNSAESITERMNERDSILSLVRQSAGKTSDNYQAYKQIIDLANTQLNLNIEKKNYYKEIRKIAERIIGWIWLGKHDAAIDEIQALRKYPPYVFIYFPVFPEHVFTPDISTWLTGDLLSLEHEYKLKLLEPETDFYMFVKASLRYEWETWREGVSKQRYLTHYKARMADLDNLDEQAKEIQRYKEGDMLSIAAVQIASCGQFNELLAIMDGNIRIADTAGRLARSGFIYEGIAVAKKASTGITDSTNDRMRAAAEIIGALIGHDQTEKILNTLEVLLDRPEQRSEVLTNASKMMRPLDPQKADELLNLAIKTTESIDEYQTAVFFSEVALRLALVGETENALSILDRIPADKPALKFEAVIEVIKRTGNTTATERLVSNILTTFSGLEPGYQLGVLRQFAYLLAANDLFDLAYRVVDQIKKTCDKDTYTYKIVAYITRPKIKSQDGFSELVNRKALFEYLNLAYFGNEDKRLLVFYASTHQKKAAKTALITSEAYSDNINILVPDLHFSNLLDEEMIEPPVPSGTTQAPTLEEIIQPEEPVGPTLAAEPILTPTDPVQTSNADPDASPETSEPNAETKGLFNLLEMVYWNDFFENDPIISDEPRFKRTYLWTFEALCELHAMLADMGLNQQVALLSTRIVNFFIKVYSQFEKCQFGPQVSYSFDIPTSGDFDKITDVELARNILFTTSIMAARTDRWGDFKLVLDQFELSGEEIPFTCFLANKLIISGHPVEALTLVAPNQELSKACQEQLPYLYCFSLAVQNEMDRLLDCLIHRIFRQPLGFMKTILSLLPVESHEPLLEKIACEQLEANKENRESVLSSVLTYGDLLAKDEKGRLDFAWKTALSVIEIDGWWKNN